MAPPRPSLRPGLSVLRRDDGCLQVGLDPGRCLVVPDEPDVRRVLDDLASGRAPTPSTGAGHRTLARLDATGLLAGLEGRPEPPPAGDGLAVGLDVPADLVAPLTDRLTCLGLEVSAEESPGVLLVLRDGPVPRSLLDRCARDGTPHLIVGADPDAVTVGPFVEPGRTACVRCIDAHVSPGDPGRALLLEQVELTVPRDLAVHEVALAWAAADLVAWGQGRVPATWSATVRLAADLDVRRTAWRRHPSCGCAWDAL